MHKVFITFHLIASTLFAIAQSSSFDLPTDPYNIGTAVYSGDENAFVNDAFGRASLAFSEDGTKLYTTWFNGIYIDQWDLSTPFQLSSISGNQAAESYSADRDVNEVLSLFFQPGGERLFIGARVSSSSFAELLNLQVGYFDLPSPYSLPPSFPNTYNVSPNFFASFGEILPLTDIAFNNQFTLLFIAEDAFPEPLIYEIGTNLNLTSSRITNSYPVSDLVSLRTIIFTPDGMTLIAGGEWLVQYQLTAPFVLDEMKVKDKIYFPDTYIEDVAFNTDGTKLFIANGGGVFEFEIYPNITVLDSTDFVLDIDTSDGSNITYSLQGEDGDVFTIDDQGVIRFAEMPEYENPGDTDQNNSYKIEISASGPNDTTTKSLAVYVEEYVEEESDDEEDDDDGEKVLSLMDESDEYSVFPNPASKSIEINGNDLEEITSLSIVSMSGQVLKKMAYKENLDISRLTPGIYFLKITVPDKVHMLKFIKSD